MAMTLWTTAGLILWIVLWSLGSKPMDAALLLGLFIVVGATIHILKNYLPNKNG